MSVTPSRSPSMGPRTVVAGMRLQRVPRQEVERDRVELRETAASAVADVSLVMADQPARGRRMREQLPLPLSQQVWVVVGKLGREQRPDRVHREQVPQLASRQLLA